MAYHHQDRLQVNCFAAVCQRLEGSKAPPCKAQLAGQHLPTTSCLVGNFFTLTGSIKHSASSTSCIVVERHHKFGQMCKPCCRLAGLMRFTRCAGCTVGAGTCKHGCSAPSTYTTALLQRQGFSVLGARTCRNLSQSHPFARAYCKANLTSLIKHADTRQSSCCCLYLPNGCQTLLCLHTKRQAPDQVEQRGAGQHPEDT